MVPQSFSNSNSCNLHNHIFEVGTIIIEWLNVEMLWKSKKIKGVIETWDSIIVVVIFIICIIIISQ